MARSTMNRQSALDLYKFKLQDPKITHKWFKQKIDSMSARRVTPSALMNTEAQDHLTSYLQPGKLYAYYYVPKYKDTLPYYDTFPLVFPYARDDETFIGLNMHYLPPRERYELFKALINTFSNPMLSENSRMRVHWDIIVQSSKMKIAQACIHRYRFDHVKSPYLEFIPDEWPLAMTLPCARFIKQSEDHVWSDSIRKFR